MSLYTRTLDCEECRKPVMKISYNLAARVAADPTNYIVFCRDHRDDA